MLTITPNYQINFESRKQFKKMFKTCAYSGLPFEPGNTKTIEHIIPKDRAPELKNNRANQIVVRKDWNEKRSSFFLGKFIEQNPQVEENIRKTVQSLEGVIIEGINWAEKVKEYFSKEIGRDIFKT